MNADTLPKNHEARSVYNRMIEVFFYFKSLEDLNETVHEHFMGYGTATHEFFKNREELMGMARMQAEQLRDQEFTLNRKPVEAKLLDNGTTCLIVEEFELHMHANEHRLSLRLSTILEHVDNKWQVTHFHGSTPDTDIAEEEAFPEEGLRRKNEELEAKIKERTRELEIEASLERVRNRAISMRSSEELAELVKTVFQELSGLDMVLTRCLLWIFNPEDQSATAWIANSEDPDVADSYYVAYHDHPAYKSYLKAWKSREPKWEYELKGKNKDRWDELLVNGYFAGLPEKIKSAMKEPDAIILSGSFNEYGVIQTASMEPLSTENQDILLRFSQVFEQSYTRFKDLETAEAQAREARVEAALERVRARTMAMQHSDELAEASHLLDKEVRDLGIKTWGCAFNIYRENDSIEWFGNEQGLLPTYTVPREGIFKEYYDLGQQGETLYVKEFSGAECIAHYEYMSTLPVVGDVLKQLKKTNGSFPSYQIDHVVFFKHGYLLFITREPVPEAYDIFRRFAKVFEQTYTRFLDLQKAEAQAREARIENALEKVRSRSIGMQKSEELREVIQVIHDQLIHLNFEIDAAGFTLDYHQNNDWNVWIANKSGSLPSLMFIPYIDHPQFNYYKYAKEKGLDFLANTLTFEEKNSIFMYMFRFMGDYPQAEKDELLSKPGLAISQAFLKNISLWIYNLDAIPYSEEENDTLMRFAKVFEQTFVRFNDLQKAEAQARESQIELALERIRAQVTGMQESSELLDIVVTMRSEFVKLGHEAHYFWHMRWLPDIYEKAMTSGDGTRIGMVMELPRHIHGEIPLLADWEKGKEPTVVYAMDAEAAVDYVDKMVSLGNFQQIDPQAPGPDDIRAIGGLTFVMARTTHGEIGFSLPGVVPDPPAEDLETLVRFTAVFDLAYRRFEDLKDSERQKREAEIELALERIRARTMAMQNSEELKEVIQVIFNQLSALQINAEHAGIVVDYEAGQDWNFWIAETQDIPSRISVPYLDLPWDRQFAEAKEKGKDFFTTHLNFEEKNSFYEKLLPHIPGITKKVRDFYFKCPGLAISTVIQNDIGLYIENFSGTPYSEEEDAILMRFGKVFQQTYTRFLDLKKAEAQAREAQIEAALEKVRTRTMAMQSSAELPDAAILLFKQIESLGIPAWSTGYCIWDEDKKNTTQWMSSEGALQPPVIIPMTEYPMFIRTVEAFQKGDAFYIEEAGGDDLAKHYEYLQNLPVVGEVLESIIEAGHQLPKYQINHNVFFSHGYLLFITYEPMPEAHDIFKRFGSVFEQTYTRFLDLQKAEAQAREAQIENALEKVRSRTMAMQHSDELPEAANVLFLEVQALGIPAWSAGYCIWEAKDKKAASCNMSSEGEFQKSFILPTIGEGYDFYTPAKKGDSFYVKELGGQALVEHYEFMRTLPTVGEILDGLLNAGLSLPTFQIFHNVYFPHGYLMFITYETVPDSHEIFQRFGKVFEQTYTRFLDLKRAEAQARESKIETALERVRARALAMQQPEELKEVAQVMRREMGLLGVEELETSSIYINDQEEKKTECWYAIKDIREEEKIMVADHFALDLKDTWVGREMLKFYKTKQEQVSIVMKGEARKEWIAYCETHSKELQGYYGEVIPERTYHLYKFSHGAIGVATPADLSEESWGLLKRAASVFSLAYSRFKDLTQARIDLQRLKEEKKRAEDALKELQLTQQQLVHAEKMASLGELTAGIAHEIKNPLNFVNNFSEVTRELVEEMIEELKNGDAEEADAIAIDVIQNLEKIVHHGQRADSIVRGMLQHSRSGDGQKEPTDLNALADEYLRLAYHGLRAQDKSFNAAMETELDDTLGQVNIVPQDIGRVLLNLLTNAFHAVKEKKEQALEGYQPKVTVKTKKAGKGVEIRVIDNGNGIPEKVLNKIFQPFFTTKPTGQGTGLGLSLSYDIIKSLGGEIKVETKNGEGTTFIISLPLTDKEAYAND